jgi:hypothetical protein
MAINKELKKQLMEGQKARVELTIEQALEFKFGKFDILEVKYTIEDDLGGNISIKAVKEGVTKEDINNFLKSF